MLSKLWFRFGIPLGSATIVTGLLDIALASYWFLNDFGSFLYFHVWDHAEPTDYRTVLGLVAVCSRLFLTLCLWIFILLGQRAILLFWIPLSVITDILMIGHGINNSTHSGLISDEVWFINIAVVVVLRFYLTSVIYQAFHRLLQNARAEEVILKLQQDIPLAQSNETDNPDDIELNSPIENGSNGQPSNTANTTTTANLNNKTTPYNHFGNHHRKSIPDKAISSSTGASAENPRYLLIEPIGESPWKILQFYNDTPRLGAAVLAIYELIWNIFALSTHSMTEFLLGGRLFFMPKEEEIFMRIWRLVVGLAALVFIFNRKKTMLRFWLIVYFWTLFASLCIFVYVMAEEWYDPPVIVVLVTCTVWFGDNMIRFALLYFCLRVTIAPSPTAVLDSTGRPNAEVARSHSLRSQSRPRSRKSRAKARFDSLQRQPVGNTTVLGAIYGV